MKWQKGKITTLIKSEDGLVRGGELAIYQKQRKKLNNIKWPVQVIVATETTNTDNDVTNIKEVNEPAKVKKRRSQQEAPYNANMLRKLNEH